MTDQHPDGWAAVPHVDGIRGTREPAAPVPTPAAAGRPRRRLRRRTLVGIVAGGAVVLLLAVTGVVGWTVQSSSHAADRPVRAFLDDLTAGRVTDALDAAGIDHDDQDVLLTDAAYAKASDHVTGYRIAGTRTDGDTATVQAVLRQDGRDVPTTFTLDRTDTDWGVFPVWELEAPELGRVEVSVEGPASTAVEVAGERVETSRDGTARLAALPGTYPVSVDGEKWFTAEDGSARVAGFGAAGSAPVAMTTSLTDAGQQAAQQAVDRWVDGCVASTDAAPAGCSFYAYGEDPAYTYSNQEWSLEQRPEVTVGGWLARGWAVSTTKAGRATYTADISGPGGVGTASAGPMNVNASGYISGFSDSGATFESAIGNGASDSGS